MKTFQRFLNLPLLVLAVSVLAISSCGDDDDGLSGDLTRSGGWNIASFEADLSVIIDAAVNVITDAELATLMLTREQYRTQLESFLTLGDIEPCSMDDIITFISDGTITVDEGGNVCTGNEEGITVDVADNSTTWERNGDQLTFTEPGAAPETVTIAELSNTRLVLRSFEVLEEDPDLGIQAGTQVNIDFIFTAN